MEAIFDFFKDFTAMLPTIKIMDIIDILVVACIIYAIITTIQTTGAARIAKSIVIILALTVVTQLLNMYLLNYLTKYWRSGSSRWSLCSSPSCAVYWKSSAASPSAS